MLNFILCKSPTPFNYCRRKFACSIFYIWNTKLNQASIQYCTDLLIQASGVAIRLSLRQSNHLQFLYHQSLCFRMDSVACKGYLNLKFRNYASQIWSRYNRLYFQRFKCEIQRIWHVSFWSLIKKYWGHLLSWLLSDKYLNYFLNHAKQQISINTKF